MYNASASTEFECASISLTAGGLMHPFRFRIIFGEEPSISETLVLHAMIHLRRRQKSPNFLGQIQAISPYIGQFCLRRSIRFSNFTQKNGSRSFFHAFFSICQSSRVAWRGRTNSRKWIARRCSYHRGDSRRSRVRRGPPCVARASRHV